MKCSWSTTAPRRAGARRARSLEPISVVAPGSGRLHARDAASLGLVVFSVARHPELPAELAAFFDDERRLLGGLDAAATPSSLPTAFGDYEILGEIARGGPRASPNALTRRARIKSCLNERNAGDSA